jgi:chloramphenicol 3-O-phosphotransferase
MQPGTIIGASTSGKTSIVKALQAIMEEPYLDAGLIAFCGCCQRVIWSARWDALTGCRGRSGGTSLVSAMHHAIATLSRRGSHVIADMCSWTRMAG